MNTGLRARFQDRLLGVSAHVNLTRPGARSIEDYGALTKKLSHIKGVRSVAPAISLTRICFRERGAARRGDQGNRS